jgi:hypothetical protein
MSTSIEAIKLSGIEADASQTSTNDNIVVEKEIGRVRSPSGGAM